MQIFRQIVYRGTDFIMDRVEVLIGGMPEGDDLDLESALLQRQNFLRDEGLRQARIPL